MNHLLRVGSLESIRMGESDEERIPEEVGRFQAPLLRSHSPGREAFALEMAL
ncbi:MAG: hypothetical protein P1U86_15315 [Verrucomicrobiales bacterium]|nr:hypothetical protein [Verrucomicrobiales bacterium]